MFEDRFVLAGIILVMILLASALSCRGVIANDENIDYERYDLSFEIYTEDVGPETMIPVRQFEARGMNYYKIDDSTVVMAWEESIFYVDIDSGHINVSGETLEVENIPLMVNDDLLISFELFEKFVEKTGLKMDDIIDFDDGLVTTNDLEELDDIRDREVVLMVVPERNEIIVEEFGNELDVKVILANNTGEVQNFTFSSGQSYDLKLVDDNGDMVYHWSRNKMFIQAIQQLELEPGENKIWETTINLNNLGPGVYDLEGWLTSRGRRINSNAQKLVIK